MNVFQKLRERGFDTVPEDFYGYIHTWKSWYDGSVRGFHDYDVFNGQQRVKCRRYTLGMAKKVCEDWANLLMNEKVHITLEGKAEQEFFDEVCRENNFRTKSNEMQEMKAALGTAAYVLRVVGAQVDAATGSLAGSAEQIKIDYCIAPGIIPLSWENGRVRECAFATSKTVKSVKYLYLTIHRLVNGTYDIDNVLYKDLNGALEDVDLHSVEGFENVPEIVHTGSKTPYFVIDRLAIANNVDYTCPMGVPVFANAIDQLKGVDVAYDSYVNEFVLGKKRILVKPEATKDLDGNPVFDPNDTVFYVLPEDSQSGSVIDSIDTSLRTGEHNTGVQDMLNVLSQKCGMGNGYYLFEHGAATTATAVVSENSDLFRTIKKHEIPLEDALIELARIVLRLGRDYMGLALNEDVEISIDFDDSIIEDKDKDRANDRQDVAMGALNLWEYRMKWRNEDEETAKAALPRMEEMVGGGRVMQ